MKETASDRSSPFALHDDADDRRIAIVGIGAVLPGAGDLAEFIAQAMDGASASKVVPDSRWPIPIEAIYSPDRSNPDCALSKLSCLLSADQWSGDDAFDPAVRVALKAGRAAWDDCLGAKPAPGRVAVILGNIILPTDATNALTVRHYDRRFRQQLGLADPRQSASFDPRCRFAAHFPAAWLAKELGLQGKTWTLDAACASTYYALKYAADQLLAGHADAVLAGGVARPDCMYTQMGFGRLGALSPSGRCAPFDGDADGLVVGEGAGIFVLKRLADAVAAGDRIHGVLCGFGLSNDVEGRLLAPSSEGQLRALRSAYANAGWAPHDVDLIECHATGAPVGDAVEVESLRRLFDECRSAAILGKPMPAAVVLGGVKSNVGHLLTAAGGAALAKVLLAMRLGRLPPNANFSEPSPKLRSLGLTGDESNLSDDPRQVDFLSLRSARPWPRRDSVQPRRAALNGFGFGGINAHVLVEEFLPNSGQASKAPRQRPRAEPIAVVAAQAVVGDALGIEAFERRVFESKPYPAAAFGPLDLAARRFRIPPIEMTDMLAQQTALLAVADDAVRQARWSGGPKHRFGAFVGVELDLDTTNFHFRWTFSERARQWARELGRPTEGAEFDAWLAELRDRDFPPLTANRVMGALAGIAASRLAREFEIGGPCHTVSCEAASGLAALDLAIHQLQSGELDEALVGAVDRATDPRHRIAMAELESATGSQDAVDAAAAVVLKRQSDALRDGNAILATIASPTGDDAQLATAMDAGAATGLIDFVYASLSVFRRRRVDSAGAHHWLRAHNEPPRRARVQAHDVLGKAWRIGVEEFAPDSVSPSGKAMGRPAGYDAATTAFVYAGSGNHYPGMGRQLALHFPEIIARHEATTRDLRQQLQPDRFWRLPPEAGWDADPLALILGQVAWSILATDCVRAMGLEPGAAIGYSLGESAALFSLGAWTDRDLMCHRLLQSSLFRSDLCGSCDSARVALGMELDERFDWSAGLLAAPEDAIRSLLANHPRVYLLIVSAPDECIVGGDRRELERLVRRVGAGFIELRGVSTVHCPLARPVAAAYRELHRLPTTPPPGIAMYSSAWQGRYEPTMESAADAILAQALDTVNFAATIEAAYADGMRTFVEIGPGNSCARAIGKILQGRPHRVFSPFTEATREVAGLDEMICRLQSPAEIGGVLKATAASIVDREVTALKKGALVATQVMNSRPLANGTQLDHAAAAHDAYLRFSQRVMQEFARQATMQADLLAEGVVATSPWVADLPAPSTEPSVDLFDFEPPRQFDRTACLEYGAGSIGRVLGHRFAEVDAFPTRVRLPDVPLNFVDRIVDVLAEPLSLTNGNVVTEHDVLTEGWYLDNGVMPTCFTVEAGQADLFLSGYLGIDFITRGQAVYRLLDAKVTFHRGLPRPGETIRYDIWIDGFFVQGQTHLFRFRFEGTIDGQPLLSMREGCAGFFSPDELASGKGIVHTALDLRPQPGKTTPDFTPFVPVRRETFDERQLAALRQGDLVGCFGDAFANLPIAKPLTLPSEFDSAGKRSPWAMKLIDRVVELDPTGGRYGLGKIRAEADIHADDWFIACHFVDDPVMPGTLMYECCLHTLRVYLLRLGWVADVSEAVCEPVPGVTGSLKCRGQVLGSTKIAAYEVAIKEIGYGPEPYVIVDALMYADGKPIVEIGGMSLKFTGMSREKLEARWARGGHEPAVSTIPSTGRLPAIYDYDRILAFAIGKPSEAFGEQYRVFDGERVIARLPGPPYQFLDRIVAVVGEPWKMKAGGKCTAQYDIPANAWYFEAERAPAMPFAVLLEVALQPCGWLAAYVGSALTSDTDLSFRNLGGNARMIRPVRPGDGILTTEVSMTRCSSSGGMVIQNYDMTVRCQGEVVYAGDTYFGFFSKQALANQVGIRDAVLGKTSSGRDANPEPFPTEAPFPNKMLRMVDRVECFDQAGGQAGLGFIRGIKQVDPTEWYFKAHFHQDPVCPGSLGLESFLQLLKFVGAKRWKAGKLQNGWLEAVLAPTTHSWIYRGQVIPADKLVTVEATVTHADDAARTLTADGFLSVDGRTIYQMKNFTLAFRG